MALALGATWAPRSSAEVESYFLRMRPTLDAGPQAKAARDWLCAAWPGAPANGRSARWWRRPASACCPDGPAASSASPSPAPSICWSTPPPSRRSCAVSTALRWVVTPPG